VLRAVVESLALSLCLSLKLEKVTAKVRSAVDFTGQEREHNSNIDKSRLLKEREEYHFMFFDKDVIYKYMHTLLK
jgi:hypothetical protein